MRENGLFDKGGLYNRTTRTIYLAPFTLHETEQYLILRGIKWTRYQIAECYMVLGSTPRYLQMLERGLSLTQNIGNLFFAQNAPLACEYDFLFRSLFNEAIVPPTDYRDTGKQGCWHDTNGDYRCGKIEDVFVLQAVWEGTHLLAVVVDGIGGYRGGDVAARLACKCIGEHIANSGGNIDSADILQTAVVYANNSICSQPCNPLLSYMSCVMTAVLIDLGTGEMDVCHIGDTRLYMLEDG